MKSSSSYYTSAYPQPLMNFNPCRLFFKERTNNLRPSNSNICEVCQKDEKMFLLNCITCKTTVHSYCYLVATYQDPWECQVCLYKRLNIANPACRACNKTEGAMRKYTKNWYHVICKIWPCHKMLSEGKCGNCKETKGKFVNCEVCFESYHPYCAILKGMKMINGRISCEEHLGFENNKEEILQNNVKEEENIEEVKKKRKIVKEDGKSKNRTEEIWISSSKKTYRLNKNIAKAIRVKDEGSLEEIRERVEDFLFQNCGVYNRGYQLSKNLQKLLGVKEILFSEVVDTIFKFCNEINL